MSYRLLLSGEGQPPPQPWRTGESLLNVRCDFGSMRDSRGWAMFHPFWLTLLDQDDPLADEWAARWRAAGHTHVVLARKYAYPSSPIQGRDFSPFDFVRWVRYALNAGFSPVLMLSDEPSEAPLVLEVVKLLKATGLLSYVICVPAWEPIPTPDWTSKQLSDLLLAMKAAGGDDIVLGVHLQPGRASMSSHPLEADDPWQGSEQGCWKSHGGEFVSVFLFQTEHSGWHDTPMLFEDRWRDVVPRFCNGMNGWRVMKVCFFESVLYNTYRNELTPDWAPKVATRARDIAKEYQGATVCYGNGVPTS